MPAHGLDQLVTDVLGMGGGIPHAHFGADQGDLLQQVREIHDLPVGILPIIGIHVLAQESHFLVSGGEDVAGLVCGATKVTYYFSAGVSIESIGFFYGWNSKQGDTDEAPSATLKIAKVELFKKLIPNSINISVDMENGSVSADPPMAVKGDIVTLTPNPAPGYQLSKIVIEVMADTEGANARTRSVPTTGGFITATKQSNGTWTFEMPDCQVSVSAIFTIKQNNTTAIEPVGVSPQDEGTWYDLRGHRVTRLHKGIYIKDGRKVLVR